MMFIMNYIYCGMIIRTELAISADRVGFVCTTVYIFYIYMYVNGQWRMAILVKADRKARIA